MTDERKVWMVTDGQYSDFHVVGVYSTEEKANVAKEATSAGDVEEWVIDGDMPPPGHRSWEVRMFANGNVWRAEHGSGAPFGDYVMDGADGHRFLNAFMWATDKKHAIKIANERRTAMILAGKF